LNTQRKARVGFLGLMLELYEEAFPELKYTVNTFALELVNILSTFADVDYPGVMCTRSQITEAISHFEKNNTDLLIVVLLTYTDSLVALPALRATRLPILIFNTQKLRTVTDETRFNEIIENHGLPGVQDLTNTLVRVGRPFSMVTGHYKDPAILMSLRGWCEAARVVAFLHETRVGLVGYRSEMMGDTSVDATSLLSQIGVQVVQISTRLVANQADQAPSIEIQKMIATDKEIFEVDPALSETEHEAGSRLEWAFQNICKEYGLSAIAYHFGAIMEDGRIKGLPFMASCKLLGEGIGIGGEGDVVGAASVAMMASLAGAATFTEVFTLDFENNAIFMNHMGEGNWRLARRDRPVRLIRADFPKTDPATVSMTFSLEPGKATLVNLTTVAGGQLKLIAAEGEVVDFPVLNDYHTPNYKFRPAMSACDFLTRYSLAGGSHHATLAYGQHADTVKKISALLGVLYETLTS
jgi:L-arabinose isomerase